MISGGTKAGTAAEVVGGESATEPSHIRAFGERVWGWVSSESLLLAVLIGSFLTRLFIADRQSYWLDELYAVTIHGGWNESLQELVRVLANITVYPPLYFVILYEWMNWLGDSEVATRLLSIIYITLAGLFLYLLLRIGFSKRIAIASVITFNLMYTPFYYSLETRPYAQTMFLVTVSSYLLLRILRRGMQEGWRLALVSPTGSIFVVANSALLLTHYYNAFFWAAQGLVACVFVLCAMRPRNWLKGIGCVAVLYGMQAAIFVGVWGRNLLREFGERSGPFTIAGCERAPEPIFHPVGQCCITQHQNARDHRVGRFGAGRCGCSGCRFRCSETYHLVSGTYRSLDDNLPSQLDGAPCGDPVPCIPCCRSCALLRQILRRKRGSSSPLLVLGVEKVAQAITNLTGRIRGVAPDRNLSQKVWAVVLGMAAIGLLVLPQGYAAATEPKADWRGPHVT